VPIGIVALLAALLLLRESRVSEAHGLDYGGVALLTLSLFLLVFPLVEGESAGWPLWLLVSFFLSVPCLIVFLAYEHRTTRRGNPLRAFIISILAIVLLSSGLSLSVLPLAGSRSPTTENEALTPKQELAHEPEEGMEQVHLKEEGACLSCQNA